MQDEERISVTTKTDLTTRKVIVTISYYNCKRRVRDRHVVGAVGLEQLKSKSTDAVKQLTKLMLPGGGQDLGFNVGAMLVRVEKEFAEHDKTRQAE